MAEKALKKVEDHLNCTICLDTYTDPKLLQCFHVYCRQCLVKLVYRDEQQQLVLTCPICRQVSPIPARGVTGLPSAFHINQLLEIVDTHKKEDDTACSGERAESDSAGNVPRGKVAQLCPDHDGKELELYCETCEELVCFHCTLKIGKHHSHDCDLLSNSFDKYKEEIKLSLNPMEKRLARVGGLLAELDAHCANVSDQQAIVEADIKTSIQQLCKDLLQALEVRETELINQLDQITQKMLKGLAVQREKVETTQAQLGSCLELMKYGLQTGGQGELKMLRMKTMIARQVRELTTPHSPERNVQPELHKIVFSASADVTAVCRKHGELSVKYPYYYEVEGQGLATAKVGVKSTVTLNVVGSFHKQFDEPIKSLQCSFIAELTGAAENVCQVRISPSQYKISYQPTIKGRHLLHVEVDGQGITGSPFSVAVRSDRSLHTAPPVLHTIMASQPRRVAVNQKGEIIVVEWGSNCISVFNPGGEKLRSFGSPGSGPGEFNSPHGVAVDGEGNILVTDGGNDRIQKFTAEGQFVAAVGSSFIGKHRPLHFDFPFGIAFNASNCKIYVSDDSNHIQILNTDLTFCSEFGMTGEAEGLLSSPRGITCDIAGNVYIADSGNSRVQVFTVDGVAISEDSEE